MKGAIYARAGRDDNGLGIQRQIDEAQAFAKSRMIEVVKVVSEVGSGTREETPAILDMITDVERGEYAYILVTDMSRWSRNIETGFTNALLLKNAGGFLVTTRSGRFV